MALATHVLEGAIEDETAPWPTTLPDGFAVNTLDIRRSKRTSGLARDDSVDLYMQRLDISFNPAPAEKRQVLTISALFYPALAKGMGCQCVTAIGLRC